MDLYQVTFASQWGSLVVGGTNLTNFVDTAEIDTALRSGEANGWNLAKLRLALQTLHNAPLDTFYRHTISQMTQTVLHLIDLKEEDASHAKTQRIAKWGLGVGIGALLVGLLAFVRDMFPEIFRPGATTSAAPTSASSPVSVSHPSAVVPRATSMSTTSPPPSAPSP